MHSIVSKSTNSHDTFFLIKTEIHLFLFIIWQNNQISSMIRVICHLRYLIKEPPDKATVKAPLSLINLVESWASRKPKRQRGDPLWTPPRWYTPSPTSTTPLLGWPISFGSPRLYWCNPFIILLRLIETTFGWETWVGRFGLFRAHNKLLWSEEWKLRRMPLLQGDFL